MWMAAKRFLGNGRQERGGYLVWTGPALLAEGLVDGLVMSRVYKTMKVAGQPYWMSGVLRRTWLPATLVAVKERRWVFQLALLDPP